MSLIIGFAAAVVSMLGWGSYLVPMKKIKKYNPFYFQLLMCTAVFASSLIISGLYNSFIFSYFGILSGILWALGNIISVIAVQKSGLSRTVPVWMGVGMFVSFLWGVLFFKEKLTSMIFGIFGIILLILGISLISATTENKQVSDFKGIYLAIISGLIFGSYLVPFKLSALEPISFLFPMSLGILIGGSFIYALKRPEADKSIILPGAFSGIIWNIANFASFFAVMNLGISVGFPLTQMALFVSVLWGLFYFREITGKSRILKILTGAVILFIGAILLAFSL